MTAQLPELGLIVAGGGTGGHLFPAIAVHEALEQHLGQPVPSLWLCSDRAIDARILGARGLDHRALAAKPLSLRPLAMLRFLGGWAPSLRAARAAIGELRGMARTVVMLSTGGFVAAPAVQGARVERCPVHAVVLDQPPGKATRWIMRHAHTIYDASLAGLKTSRPVERVGPVVRAEALIPDSRQICCAHWGLDPSRPVLLITGGSLGAKTLNDFAFAFIDAHAKTLSRAGWQVLHQVGGADEASLIELSDRYREFGIDAAVVSLLHPMGAAWGAADLALCRAGAGTVAEVAANAIPSVFMPYPFHRDQHQHRNAAPLVEAGGSLLCTDHQNPQANMRSHAQSLLELMESPRQREEMRTALVRRCSDLVRPGYAPQKALGARAIAESLAGSISVVSR